MGHWTADEDKKLKDAVRVHGGKNWGAIAALVPGRTKGQCRKRWCDALDPGNGRATARAGTWTLDEDKMLKDAVRTYGSKKRNWETIAALVPCRTKVQCRNRWHEVLVSNIDPATARTGKWTADEDTKLKDAVLARGCKNWKAIAALVPSRTTVQCRKRWHATLDPGIGRATVRAGTWTADEDERLKAAVQIHGGKNWEEIAALVPGRTKVQCRDRWHKALVSNINPATARTGKWTADEDKKLKDAAATYGAKNWKAIAALVPGRTKVQCCNRWHEVLVSNIDSTTARMGKEWTEDEDKTLKDAVPTHGVQTYGDTDWAVIAALVPGRTKKSCWHRWKKLMDSTRSTVRGE
jgi:myb proto-oncogene protein